MVGYQGVRQDSRCIEVPGFDSDHIKDSSSSTRILVIDRDRDGYRTGSTRISNVTVTTFDIDRDVSQI
jgi:hypothetical protein